MAYNIRSELVSAPAFLSHANVRIRWLSIVGEDDSLFSVGRPRVLRFDRLFFTTRVKVACEEKISSVQPTLARPAVRFVSELDHLKKGNTYFVLRRVYDL